MVKNSTPDNGSNNGTAWVTVSGGTLPYTYLWNPGGNTADSIYGESAGSYCCTVTDANNCTDSVCISINSTAGIDNIASDSSQITVYPNPNTGEFILSFSHPELVSGSHIQIYNMLGEKIYDEMLKQVQHDYEINIDNKPNGVYLYRVISDNGNLVGEGKLIIQK